MAVITAGRKFDMHMAKRKNHERGPNHIGNKKRQAEKPAIIVYLRKVNQNDSFLRSCFIRKTG